MPDTFCALPYSHLNITMEGKATLCCRAAEHVERNGRPLSLYTDSFEEIWNSEYLRSVRAGMLRGERISACEHCYRNEASGGTSLRQTSNANSLSLLGAPPERAAESAAAAVARGAGRLEAPRSLHLWLGNLCNLKCRMCHGAFSSQIAADAVHSAWAGFLERDLVLLPDFVPGVSYRGLDSAPGPARSTARAVDGGGRVEIEVPGNGDPLIELEIAGTRTAVAPTTLAIRAGEHRLLETTLTESSWSRHFRPELPVDTGSPLALRLDFGGATEGVALSRLRIVCRGAVGKAYPAQLASRLSPDLQWAESREIVLDEILADPARLRHLLFAGGEPMLNPHLPALLEMLVESGHASHISLFFSSNATVLAPRMLELFRAFQSVSLAFSLDGTGALQEYIRPPARWETVWKNVLRYHDERPGVEIHTTPQAYNAFGLLDLVRQADTRRMAIRLNNILYSPRWLSLDMLPQAVVEEAREEWRGYRATECREEHLGEVDTLIGFLERPRAENQSELQEQFIRFTADLDRSRSQSLALANARLHARLVECGFDLRT